MSSAGGRVAHEEAGWRYSAKPGPGLRLCVQGIPRIFHGGALFLAIHAVYTRRTYSLQDGCCSEYYSKSVHRYPREIMLVSIPKYSAADNSFCQGRA